MSQTPTSSEDAKLSVHTTMLELLLDLLKQPEEPHGRTPRLLKG